MSEVEIWITVALLALATALARCSFFLFGGADRLPPKVQHALRYAPAVAMGAILLPDLVLAGGTADISPWNPRLVAAAGATIFFLATRHLLGTIIAGMLLYTALRLML
jgi:branched-subunit amino acid transport protein